MKASGSGLRAFVVFVLFVSFVVGSVAQSDVTEAQLDAASGGQTIRLGTLADGRVTVIPLETYVARVLAGEGEPRAGDAAQQALAVAIRTFALANTGRHGQAGFDLCDSTHCQVVRASTAATRRATLATAGRILTYNGRPAEVFYSASCGGRTERAADVWPDADLPYLQGVDDEDVHGQDQPWSVELTLGQIEEALLRAGFDGRLRDIDVADRSASGRVSHLSLTGMRPAVIGGDQFRGLIGAGVLRSTAFDMDSSGSVRHFTGRGYGHGVGLCVIGAGRRALRGESAEAILATYFPGLTLSAGLQPGSGIRTPVPAPPVTNSRIADPGPRTSEPGLAALVTRVHAELSKATGVSVAPITAAIHPTIESFRSATGQPWWVSVVASGTSIELAPAVVLAQRDGVEAAVRLGVAELMVAGPLAQRPVWVRIGAAKYFAGGASDPALPNVKRCPSDAELTLAVSAAAQREAEQRAEACFVRGLARARSWRDVR